MTLGRFLAGKVHSNATVKVIWPESNMIAIGQPVEFFQKPAMLAANVFDFMVADPEVGYNVIVWLTKSSDTMFDI